MSTHLIRAFTSGYKSGHHDTVEGKYVDVHDCDRDTYFSETVEEMMTQGEFAPLDELTNLRESVRRLVGEWEKKQSRNHIAARSECIRELSALIDGKDGKK